MDGSGAYLIVLAVLATMFGGLAAFVAAQKGRSSGEGFAIGFLFGPLGVLVELCLPTIRGGHDRQKSFGNRTAAPGPVRPRRSISPDDVDITGSGDPSGWKRYRRGATGEEFWSPAPEPESPPEPVIGPKRWERPLRQVDGE